MITDLTPHTVAGAPFEIRFHRGDIITGTGLCVTEHMLSAHAPAPTTDDDHDRLVVLVIFVVGLKFLYHTDGYTELEGYGHPGDYARLQVDSPSRECERCATPHQITDTPGKWDHWDAVKGQKMRITIG